MSRQWDIFSEEDFLNMVESFGSYFKLRQDKNLPFQKIKIISKKWQKPKTSKQHRSYWMAIGKLKDIFIKHGHEINDETVHEFIKRRAGYTYMLKGELVTKSISDLSDDATTAEVNRLIDCIQRFAIETFNEVIDIGGAI